ncbi:aminopeptidase N [Fibrisoma limi BUZ 3]|uniref:Aminopeptidase N n=1 Tax=Fibrisoma limi BUZ 3 TaxID=1185876 RepID=I2GF42_9BACT|nr:M1 family aminopeptidase [Fibrisoma limi]CCH52517.1 aminopeptidase N [Fibrisoma limi BUZ 3]
MSRLWTCLLTSLGLLNSFVSRAQLTTLADTGRSTFYQTRTGTYHPSRTRTTDLLHTDLNLRFDWARQYVEGTATLRCTPYFYPQTTVELDAKGFLIRNVLLIDTLDRKPVRDSLRYEYADGQVLRIRLPRAYTRRDTFDIRIDYVARPNELPAGGSQAITSDKGLYFINPTGSEPDKPRQIWTQGETEANSAWFPTIDAPNEKMTQAISLTVENQFRTLSNGRLVSSQSNPDGTRTDLWVQAQPHAPYLAMVAVGNFAYVSDQLPRTPDRGPLTVGYYVEPAYEPFARQIFGRTPAMITFFEKLFGTPFVWDKYSQIAVRDFVSGAMENTTATVHQEGVQMDARELVDGNSDAVIAHELAHHWFGDLVTCESWANLPLNEAFATYAEYLWFEHARGRDEAELHGQMDLAQYLSEAETKQEPLIRYRYADREDMFDAHSYAKGGRVLHFLRKIIGDDAFFRALTSYLKRHRFSTAEVDDLRQAFEEATGQDLHWFFEQWFLSPGHAVLAVEPTYDAGTVNLRVTQKQDTTFTPIYRLPVRVDIWVKGRKTSYDVVVDQAQQTLTFPADQRPDLVLFDADHRLVGTIDQPKSQRELIFQYYHAELYQDRSNAILAQDNTTLATDGDARVMVIAALNDPFWQIRQIAVRRLASYVGPQKAEVQRLIRERLRNDSSSAVRAEAIQTLASYNDKVNLPLFKAALTDSSYMVVAVALERYLAAKPADAKTVVAKLEHIRQGEVLSAVADYYAEAADPGRFDWFVATWRSLKPGEQYNFLQVFAKYLLRSSGDIQRRAVPLLEKAARQDASSSVRFGAYQALGLLLDVPGVEAIRQRIRANERDPQLKELFEKLGAY